MIDIKVERLIESNISELHNFFQVTLLDTFKREVDSGYEEDVKEEVETKMKYLKEDLDSNGELCHFILAKLNNKIIGTVCYRPYDNLITKCSNGKYKDEGAVGTVYILPEYQNMGVGSKLMHAILDYIKSINIETFCLDSGFKIAQKFWIKKLGEPQLIVKDFWDIGYDHYIWRVEVKKVINNF